MRAYTGSVGTGRWSAMRGRAGEREQRMAGSVLDGDHVVRSPSGSGPARSGTGPPRPVRGAYGSQVRPLEIVNHRRLATPVRRNGARWRRRLVGLALVVALGVALAGQANGAGGAATADWLRAALGPAATARVEAAYLDLLDTMHALAYRAGGQPAHAPWAVVPSPAAPAHPASKPSPLRVAASPRAIGSTGTLGPAPARVPAPTGPMVPPSLLAVVTPALAGEGMWTTAGLPGPGAGAGALPPLVKTFLRPDPSRPYALATILQVDLRVARLHVVAGVSEPGGPVGKAGQGLIPAGDTRADRLLAVFNGGFKYADGAYGLMSGTTVYVPPVWGAATIAVTRSGGVIMGSWGRDHRLTGANRNLVAWRQNADLLIDRGRIAARTQDGAGWGLTVLNSTYTWRSGIGLTSRGTLLYAAGGSLSAATLAKTLRTAGAVTAMQLDINPYWVRAFTYGRDRGGGLVAWALDPAMPGIGMEYLYGAPRDFFYLTRGA